MTLKEFKQLIREIFPQGSGVGFDSTVSPDLIHTGTFTKHKYTSPNIKGKKRKRVNNDKK